MKNIKWIGRAKGEIQSFSGNPLDNISGIKDEINEVRASLLLRKVFVAKKPVKKAIVKICGLGLYTLTINGKKVGDRVLAPIQSNYREVAYYDELDATDCIMPQKNVMIIELGTGQYAAPKKRWDWRMVWYGNVRVAAELEIEYCDGTKESIATDESFKMHDGAVVESCIYDGEKYDARLLNKSMYLPEFDDSRWDSAVEVECPTKELKKNTSAPVKICNTYSPVDSWEVSEGTLYDFGENRTGWAKIAVSGMAGSYVTIKFCERLEDCKEPDYTTNRGADAFDVYTLCGDGIECYAPQFTFHGFRYAIVIKSDNNIKLHKIEQENIHAAVKENGTFISDNADLNKIHRACTLTQTNGFMWYPIDCPQRDERMGWLGDAHVTAETAVYNFNMLEYYRKWLTDIRIDTAPDGEVPHIAPWPQRKEPSPVDWSSGYLIIALTVYKMYGDKSIIEEHYESFKKYMDYLYSISDNYVLPQGRYGDWSSSEEGFTRGNPYYDNTLFYYYTLLITKECAKILDRQDDVSEYTQKLSQMKERCIELYYDRENKTFGDGKQFSLGMALMTGLVPDEDYEAVFDTLLKTIEKANGHIIGGIFGVQYVMEVLRQFDRGDIAVDAMLKKEYPSWLDMLSRSTTITENWTGEGVASQNHCMLGSVDAALYKILGGINVDMTKDIPVLINPYITEHCGFVKTETEIPVGKVVSQWIRYDDYTEIDIIIPEGIKAEFKISKLNSTENMTLNGKVFTDKAELSGGFNTIIIKK